MSGNFSGYFFDSHCRIQKLDKIKQWPNYKWLLT